jgi:hypothetical protein
MITLPNQNRSTIDKIGEEEILLRFISDNNDVNLSVKAEQDYFEREDRDVYNEFIYHDLDEEMQDVDIVKFPENFCALNKCDFGNIGHKIYYSKLYPIQLPNHFMVNRDRNIKIEIKTESQIKALALIDIKYKELINQNKENIIKYIDKRDNIKRYLLNRELIIYKKEETISNHRISENNIIINKEKETEEYDTSNYKKNVLLTRDSLMGIIINRDNERNNNDSIFKGVKGVIYQKDILIMVLKSKEYNKVEIKKYIKDIFELSYVNNIHKTLICLIDKKEEVKHQKNRYNVESNIFNKKQDSENMSGEIINNDSYNNNLDTDKIIRETDYSSSIKYLDKVYEPTRVMVVNREINISKNLKKYYQEEYKNIITKEKQKEHDKNKNSNKLIPELLTIDKNKRYNECEEYDYQDNILKNNIFDELYTNISKNKGNDKNKIKENEAIKGINKIKITLKISTQSELNIFDSSIDNDDSGETLDKDYHLKEATFSDKIGNIHNYIGRIQIISKNNDKIINMDNILHDINNKRNALKTNDESDNLKKCYDTNIDKISNKNIIYDENKDCKHYFSIIESKIKSEELFKAKEIFKNLSFKKMTKDDKMRTAYVGYNLITALLHNEDWEGAEEILHYLERISKGIPFRELKAKATFSFIIALDSVSLTHLSEEAYQELRRITRFSYLDELRILANKKIILSLMRQGFLDNAHRLVINIYDLGDNDRIRFLFSKIIYELILLCGLKRLELSYLNKEIIKNNSQQQITIEQFNSIINTENISLIEQVYSNVNLDEIMPQDTQNWAMALENLTKLFLEAGKPETASKIFLKMEDFALSNQREIYEARARIGYRVLRFFIDIKNTENAIQLFGEMNKMVNSCEVSVTKAKAAVALIQYLSRIGYPNLAEPILLTLREYPRTQEIMTLEGKAASVCMGYLEDDHETALKIYEHYLPLKEASDYRQRLAKLAANTIYILVNDQEFDKAFDFYLDFKKRLDLNLLDKEIINDLASVLAVLLEGYLEKGETKQAIKIFELIEDEAFGYEETKEIKALLSVNLVGALCAKGCLSEAEEIYRDMDKFLESDSIIRQKARAGVNLLASIMEAEDDIKSKSIYDEIEELCVKYDISNEILKAASNAVIIFSGKGFPEKGEVYLQKLLNHKKTEEREHFYAKSLAHLTASFAKLGLIDESLKEYKKLEKIDSLMDIVHFRFFAVVPLLKLLMEKDESQTSFDIISNIKELNIIKNNEINLEFSSIITKLEKEHQEKFNELYK